MEQRSLKNRGDFRKTRETHPPKAKRQGGGKGADRTKHTVLKVHCITKQIKAAHAIPKGKGWGRRLLPGANCKQRKHDFENV